MRLLLDEHYSPKIAVELRKRGHDVVSANERDDLRGLADRKLWSISAGERRAFVTENVADFMPLLHEAVAESRSHAGLLFTSPRSLPRGPRTIGLFVKQLGRFLREHSAEDALADQVFWLGAA